MPTTRDVNSNFILRREPCIVCQIPHPFGNSNSSSKVKLAEMRMLSNPVDERVACGTSRQSHLAHARRSGAGQRCQLVAWGCPLRGIGTAQSVKYGRAHHPRIIQFCNGIGIKTCRANFSRPACQIKFISGQLCSIVRAIAN